MGKGGNIMNNKAKRIVALIVIFVMILSVFSPIQSSLAAEETENMKVDDALLEVIGITYDDLVAGDYQESNEMYSCIIWMWHWILSRQMLHKVDTKLLEME